MLCTLRYIAKADFFSEVGDIHGVSKSYNIQGVVDAEMMFVQILLANLYNAVHLQI